MEKSTKRIKNEDVVTERSAFQMYKDAMNKGNFTQALKCLLKAAIVEDVEAEAELGFCYVYGILVKQDYEKAVGWYLRACIQQNIRAISELAWLYMFYFEDLDTTAYIFQKYLPKSYLKKNDAFYITGLCYASHLYDLNNTEKDAETLDFLDCINDFKNVVKNTNDPQRLDAMYGIASLMPRAKIITFKSLTQIQWMQKAANEGYVPALLKLVEWSAQGKDEMPKSEFCSVLYKQEALKKGCLWNTKDLAYYAVTNTMLAFYSIKYSNKLSTDTYINNFIFFTPKGIFKKINGMIWETRNEPCWKPLYKKDSGVDLVNYEELFDNINFKKYQFAYKNQQYKNAFKYLSIAQEYGDNRAICELSNHYRFGTLQLRQDDQEEFMCLTQTFENGSREAILKVQNDEIKNFYQRTDGSSYKKDNTAMLQVAFEEMEIFSSKNYWYKGKRYFLGINDEQELFDMRSNVNFPRAFLNFCKGVRKGSIDKTRCCYEKGFCYENGVGVNRDIKKALFWYCKAAKRGMAIAQYAVSKLLLEDEKWDEYNYWQSKLQDQCLDYEVTTELLKIQRLEEKKTLDSALESVIQNYLWNVLHQKSNGFNTKKSFNDHFGVDEIVEQIMEVYDQ